MVTWLKFQTSIFVRKWAVLKKLFINRILSVIVVQSSGSILSLLKIPLPPNSDRRSQANGKCLVRNTVYNWKNWIMTFYPKVSFLNLSKNKYFSISGLNSFFQNFGFQCMWQAITNQITIFLGHEKNVWHQGKSKFWGHWVSRIIGYNL